MDIFDSVFSSINDELDVLSRSVQSPVNDQTSTDLSVEKGGVLNPEKDRKESTDAISSEVIAVPMEVPTEISNPVEPIIVNINLEKTKEPLTPSSTSPVNNIATASTLNNESATINSQSINEKSAPINNTTNRLTEVTSLNQSIDNSQNSINSSSESQSSQNTINSSSESQSSQNTINESIESVATEFYKMIQQFSKNSTNFINWDDTTTSSDFSTDSSASSYSINEYDKFDAFSNNISEDQRKYLNQYLGINLGENSTNSNETTVTSEKVNQTEVIKEPLSFPEKIQPTLEIQKSTSEPTASEIQKTGSESVTVTPVNEIKNDVTSSNQGVSPQTPAPVTNYQSTQFDLSLVESRLSRIEYLLSNTLEVKIID